MLIILRTALLYLSTISVIVTWQFRVPKIQRYCVRVGLKVCSNIRKQLMCSLASLGLCRWYLLTLWFRVLIVMISSFLLNAKWFSLLSYFIYILLGHVELLKLLVDWDLLKPQKNSSVKSSTVQSYRIVGTIYGHLGTARSCDDVNT